MEIHCLVPASFNYGMNPRYTLNRRALGSVLGVTIPFFRDVALHTLFINVGIPLPSDTASYPRKNTVLSYTAGKTSQLRCVCSEALVSVSLLSAVEPAHNLVTILTTPSRLSEATRMDKNLPKE